AGAVHAVGDTAGAFERRRHSRGCRSGRRSQRVLILRSEEEEELVLMLVEELRNPEGPADGVAEVALIQLRLRREVPEIACRVAARWVIVDPRVGVHAVVASEGVERAMKILRPASR